MVLLSTIRALYRKDNEILYCPEAVQTPDLKLTFSTQDCSVQKMQLQSPTQPIWVSCTNPPPMEPVLTAVRNHVTYIDIHTNIHNVVNGSITGQSEDAEIGSEFGN